MTANDLEIQGYYWWKPPQNSGKPVQIIYLSTHSDGIPLKMVCDIWKWGWNFATDYEGSFEGPLVIPEMK